MNGFQLMHYLIIAIALLFRQNHLHTKNKTEPFSAFESFRQIQLYKSSITIITGLFLSIPVFAQKSFPGNPNIVFEPFEGKVYTMPIIEKRSGNRITKRIRESYTEDVLNYELLTEVSLDQLKIPETTIGRGTFPGVDKSIGFCMILHSKMYVKEDGCYEFSLNSDDGSILWIDNIEVINNDGGHQMKLKSDSLTFTKGEYQLKLWYFQGMPDRFGIMFDTKYLGDTLVCDKLPVARHYEINNELLFAFGKYELSESALSELEQIIKEFNNDSIQSIEIIGHTDNIGSQESNLLLSQRRADSIAAFFRKKLKDNTILIETVGKGESEPKSSNDSENGRAKNRRVLISIVLNNEE